jgi:hypothetical protein
MRPHRPTPCELPHFAKAGKPRDVAGMVYRHATGAQVLCRAHGQALIDRIAQEVVPATDE